MMPRTDPDPPAWHGTPVYGFDDLLPSREHIARRFGLEGLEVRPILVPRRSRKGRPYYQIRMGAIDDGADPNTAAVRAVWYLTRSRALMEEAMPPQTMLEVPPLEWFLEHGGCTVEGADAPEER